MGNMLAFSIGSRDLGTINMHKVTTPITLRCAEAADQAKTSTINSEVLREGSRNIFTPRHHSVVVKLLAKTFRRSQS